MRAAISGMRRRRGGRSRRQSTRFPSRGPDELAIPVLALLAEIDSIEQARARAVQRRCLATVRKSGIGTCSTGASRRKKQPIGVKVAFAKRSSCLSVGRISPRSQASSLGNRPASASRCSIRRVGAPSAAARAPSSPPPHRHDPCPSPVPGLYAFDDLRHLFVPLEPGFHQFPGHVRNAQGGQLHLVEMSPLEVLFDVRLLARSAPRKEAVELPRVRKRGPTQSLVQNSAGQVVFDFPGAG